LRLSQGFLAVVVALTIILGLSLSSATVEQQRILSEFTTETSRQVHASAEALSRLDSIRQDMRMLADLVDRSRHAGRSDAATELRVWESAFRALAVVVVHYRIIALVAGDGTLNVLAVDPTEDAATARALLPRVEQLGTAATSKSAERLGGVSPFPGRSFLLCATPVPSGGAIVVASDAALLLRSVAWPQVPSGRLFVTDPSGVVWSGCEASRGCQVTDAKVVPRNLAASTRAPFRVDARQAKRLGLYAADAIWVSENVPRSMGSWTVTWVASTQPILAREQSTLARIAATAIAAAIVVAMVGIVLMRQQHHADELASQLVYAKAQAKAHELENELVRADRLVTVGVMATEIAHEIGTPLGVVRGRAEQVLPKLADRAGVDDLRVVIKQVDHISSTIRQLLDFARRSPFEKRSVSLEMVVERTRELLQLKLEARRLQLDLELDADLPQLTADPDQLQQVLVNLLLNACDASRTGDRLSISARRAPNEMVLIQVSDPGCGIPAEHLESIFEPFFTTKPRGEGTGLGLPIAVGIVRNHGGQIDVVSGSGRGTTVTVLWPASAPSEGIDA
jgi:signal transduction histidine kinase